MEILEQISSPDIWREFLKYKIEKQHLSEMEQKELEEYIKKRKYIPLLDLVKQPGYNPPYPIKRQINKSGISKKRVVYSYPADFNIFLKMIAFLLYKYDNLFVDNCYAFRREYGVKDAIRRIRLTENISEKYCLKVDISNYFNSIYVPMLLEKLAFLKKDDNSLYQMFEKLLMSDKAVVDKDDKAESTDKNDKVKEEENRKIIVEKRGAMAGIPVSPFFANVYLMDIDWYFKEKGILYFRYSDDILIFADSYDELRGLQEKLCQMILAHHLTLNPAKVQLSRPDEAWEFLGFAYVNGRVDLSGNTKRKLKKKIKRKAHALRRWQTKRGLSGDKAAKGFIKAMNHKFFDNGEGTEFSWSRWFFPNLTTDEGLKEVDAYLQQYIRYCVTGRHYKGNYRITYGKMKEWGYRNLVHEYYQSKQKR